MIRGGTEAATPHRNLVFAPETFRANFARDRETGPSLVNGADKAARRGGRAAEPKPAFVSLLIEVFARGARTKYLRRRDVHDIFRRPLLPRRPSDSDDRDIPDSPCVPRETDFPDRPRERFPDASGIRMAAGEKASR